MLTTYIKGRYATELGQAPSSHRRATVLEGFRRFFGAEAVRPAGYPERDWNAQEWTRGCYGANTVPGTLTGYGSALRAPVGPLHWAGTETARRWIGFMEGAIEAGQRAAAEAVGGSEDA